MYAYLYVYMYVYVRIKIHGLVNEAKLVHNLFLVYLFLSVFINLYMFWETICSFIRRNSCVYATLGNCYSVWITVWYAGVHTRQSSNK